MLNSDFTFCGCIESYLDLLAGFIYSKVFNKGLQSAMFVNYCPKLYLNYTLQMHISPGTEDGANMHQHILFLVQGYNPC